MATVDHRRAIAGRNRVAIVDAVEHLLARHEPLSMAAVAAEAGVSRPTLYAHFKSLAEILEAAVKRSVDDSMATIEATDPEEGPADAALERMVAASWNELGNYEPLARGAVEFLSREHLERAHAPILAVTLGLIERGQRDGTFRRDLPAPWLASAYYSLIQGAEEAVQSQGIKRDQALKMLKRTVRDLLAAR